jgi:N-hydroxyarylamine O-acetyltransferase
LELLAALQLAHMVHVPFENLHVYHRRRPRTDAEWSVHKIVDERRGGWCFEVNGAFATLLRAVGFRAHHVSCQVWEAGIADWGPPFDHLATVVEVDGARWFVDVGFGDNCIEPLAVAAAERASVPRTVRTVVNADDDGVEHLVLSELMPVDDRLANGDASWEPQLRVRLEPTTLDRFTPRSTHLQTHPGLSWQEKAFATRALDASGSRVTLRSAVLRRRDGSGPYVDTTVAPTTWSALLFEHFGLVDTLER